MQRPLLMIVDGESLKTPGLERALEGDGWDLAWTTSQHALNVPLMGQEPSLVLLDPARSGEAGIRAINALRAQNPSLPVVVLEREGWSSSLPSASGHMEPNLPAEQWPAFLRVYMPQPSVSDRKLTTEDLFGDILADIEGVGAKPATPAPSPVPVKAAEPVAPAPKPVAATAPQPSAPVPVPPAKPMTVQVPGARPAAPRVATPIPAAKVPSLHPSVHPSVHPSAHPSVQAAKPVTARTSAPAAAVTQRTVPVKPAQASAPSPTAPVPPVPEAPLEPLATVPEAVRPVALPPSPVPMPPAPTAPVSDALVLPDIFGDLLGPLEEHAAPDIHKAAKGPLKPKDEFTLSGFSGINDPFEFKAKEDVPEPKPQPRPQPKGKGEPLEDLGDGVIDLEFIGTSDSTPVTRPPAQPSGSLVVQPPPRPPAPPELEPIRDSPENPVLEEFGNYYLLEKIAVGGMAELFKARQRGVHNFEKIVAIKRILPHLSDNDEFVRMFIDEAKLAAQLTHPNIVQIFDLGKASGFYYIAMEYVDGKDLRSLLRKVREYRSPFPEAVAAYVTMKVAMALDYAHRKRGMNDKELKLVHRDVSPQNVLISSGEGAVKLVDFGIAKAATKSTQTMAGALKGKLLYMSPEQALGQSLDNRSDIYSLGLVLFELLTGERCFQADSELGVLEKVRLGKVQDVQTVNPVVSRDMAIILTKALQKNVDQRYSSARLMERDLKSLLVRHGNEPTDHDVAEYVNTLLKGTKEQLDQLLSTHYAVQAPKNAAAASAQPRLQARVEDPPTSVEVKKSMPLPEPPPEIRMMDKPERPIWLLPTLIGAALIAGGAITWFLTR